MRLKKIQLAGFKSFVDPTTLDLRSNLVAVLGPNGCGKSNIIDAVRWVMGESSAKHLRGESMADVIFNGSSTRKPIGQASVELIFDNSDGSLGGEYAAFSEIAIRRLATRDGQSQYFLNGTRCRRRDITDIFLGTGLGPRSYAIIEQGMISRVVEAKPQELRVYIEEAAGISKYKERRRETEIRIKHTQENLSRVDDLQQEIERQLGTLKRQAASAERYKVLADEARQVQSELHGARYRNHCAAKAQAQEKLTAFERELFARQSTLTQLDAQWDTKNVERQEVVEARDRVQKEFYQLSSETARIEQQLSHWQEQRENWQKSQGELSSKLEAALHDRRRDQQALEALTAQLVEQTPRLQQTENDLESAKSRLTQQESNTRNERNALQNFIQSVMQRQRDADLERTRITHLEEQLQSLNRDREKYEEERDQLDPETLLAQKSELDNEAEDHKTAQAKIQEEIARAGDAVNQMREQIKTTQQKLHESRGKIQEYRGKKASLEALQQAALGKDHKKTQSWLADQGLAQAARLAEGLNVESGWETALETVLGGCLEAVMTDDFTMLEPALAEVPNGGMMVIERAATITHGSSDTLAGKVQGAPALQHDLSQILTAETLTDAFSKRLSLTDQQSIITKDGYWLGKHWIRTRDTADPHTGVLAREAELKTLSIDIDDALVGIEALETQLEQEKSALQDREEQREQANRELRLQLRDEGELRAKLSRVTAQIEQMNERRSKIEERLAQQQAQQVKWTEEVHARRATLEQLVEQMASDTAQRAEREKTLDIAESQVQALRNELQTLNSAYQNLRVEVAQAKSQQQSYEQSLARLSQQITQSEQEKVALHERLVALDEPEASAKNALDTLLEKRVTIEASLSQARDAVNAVEVALQEIDKTRHAESKTLEGIRTQVEKHKLAIQEHHVRLESEVEQLAELELTLEDVLKALPEDVDPEEWHQRHQQLQAKIQRLGPINLAAIDEYKEQSERKATIDAQHADLTEAMDTLQKAIQKIDRETRQRFKVTFDHVNEGLKNLFPRLFGGGAAYLELTSDDILDAGCELMARPPGKRNSSIHLLSGGEKALTAVALVFSIFQLNPAPFCMLDEVDAPLDDANVGRYCTMVKDMAQSVQFIYISHNKLAMEMADQLAGVTMKEPGVSRLVTVDIDEAVSMAEA